MGGLKGCGELIDWQQLNHLQYSNSNNTSSKILQDDYYHEEAEGVQSEEESIYVKVTMDGVVVGRKLSMLDHSSYCSVALQLEDMFGRPQ